MRYRSSSHRMERQRNWLRHVGMAGWTGSDDAGSLAALQRAVDLGCIFRYRVAYGDGHSEQLLRKILRATK